MVGNGVWLHNIGRVVKQKLHNNLTPSAMVSTLTDAEIAVMVIQKDGSYKVLGAPHMTKDEAKASLERTKAVAGDDLFVTTVEVRLQ
jgi:lysophospholipid acyltransferase (LPLAT)-like uncharacterized protein